MEEEEGEQERREKALEEAKKILIEQDTALPAPKQVPTPAGHPLLYISSNCLWQSSTYSGVD